MTPATLKSIIFEIDEFFDQPNKYPEPVDELLKKIRRTLKAELTRETPVEENPLFEQIIHVYNNLLTPALPKAKLTDGRKRAIRACFDRHTECGISVQWWGHYFKQVAASDVLTGKKLDWAANFDWLLNKTNMQKVLDGNYTNRGTPRPSKETEVDDYLDGVRKETEDRRARILAKEGRA